MTFVFVLYLLLILGDLWFMTSLLRFVAMVALCMFKNKMNIKIKMYVIYHPHSGMYFLPRYISFFTWDKSDMIVPGDLRR